MERVIAAPQAVTLPVIAGAGVVIACVTGIWYSFARGRGLGGFGLLWLGGILVPSLYVYPIQGILYEHWLYLPLVGPAIVAGSLWVAALEGARRPWQRHAIVFLLGVVLVAWSARSIIREMDWRDPIRFYEGTVADGGGTARVYNNLGMAYDDALRHEEALAAYARAATLDDRLFPPRYNMGNTYRALGRDDDALAAYAAARERAPDFLPAYINAAAILLDRGDSAQAAEILHTAHMTMPDDPQIAALLASAQARSPAIARVRMRRFAAALRQNPTNAQLQQLLVEIGAQ